MQKRFAYSAHEGDKDVVQVLAPFIGNANAIVPIRIGNLFLYHTLRDSPMAYAIYNGHTEIIKLLAPLCDDYIWQDSSWKMSLIHCAVQKRQAEAIQILAPFMKNPNVGDRFRNTPICYARNLMGFGPNHEVIQILEKLQ